jgi:transcription factor C subunit 7
MVIDESDELIGMVCTREFYGTAHFKHPIPAPLSELAEDFFPGMLDTTYTSICSPPVGGETIPALHDRIAHVVHRALEDCENNHGKPDAGPKAILICTHAAPMIVLGRVLTGNMPEDPSVDDFQCYTASLSVYRRRRRPERSIEIKKQQSCLSERAGRDSLAWRGVGVGGGWDCEKNADCSHLSGGAERGW